jgi:hypothetical protein
VVNVLHAEQGKSVHFVVRNYQAMRLTVRKLWRYLDLRAASLLVLAKKEKKTTRNTTSKAKTVIEWPDKWFV